MSGKSAPRGEYLRNIPQVDAILSHPGAQPHIAEVGRDLFTHCLRETLDDLRAPPAARLKSGAAAAVDETSILAAVGERLAARRAPKLGRAINATGVILHTGLGRAVLPRAALEAIAAEQEGYSLLEVDHATG